MDKMDNDAGGQRDVAFNRSPTNPMLIDSVLEQVMRHLSDDDLQNSRFVCRLWNKEAQFQQQKRHYVNIDCPKDAVETLVRYHTEKDFKISSLLIRNCHLDNVHIQKLLLKATPTISCLSLLDDKIPNLEFYRNIMREIGPQLIKCDLGTIKLPISTDWEDFNEPSRPYIRLFPIQDLTTGESLVFPKMREFEFVVYVDFEEEMTFLSEVLKAMPNLRSLVCNSMAIEHPNKFNGIQMPNLINLSLRMLPHGIMGLDQPNVLNLCSCCNEERERGEIPLSEINLRNRKPGGLKPEHIAMLTKLDLKLTYLQIINVNLELNPAKLTNFIQSFKPTLKSLDLQQFKFDPESMTHATTPSPNPFPLDLPFVKTLVIDRSFIKNINHVFLPNAHEIHFKFYESADWQAILPNRISPPKNLSYIRIDSIDTRSLTKLAAGFQFLLHLDIRNCNDAQLSIIFEKLPCLKRVSFEEGEEEDRKITAAGLTAIKDSVPLSTSAMEIEKMQFGKPFIGNLKSLEYFSIQTKNFDATFIERIAVLGVSKCPRLKYFVMEEGPKVMPKHLVTEMSKLDFVYIEVKQGNFPVVFYKMHQKNNTTDDGEDKDDDEYSTEDYESATTSGTEDEDKD